ncbi:uncharacterized protein LOC101854180 [Aplysia californica]|uniref:Uncharacterized protein LOC101854180 n=1 Tax=Aplysia californica TaxID=6500 RepID=A0ABM1A3V7_APLCA|nr:uncharacterized protein LOC101854180 [Aplysia californica]
MREENPGRKNVTADFYRWSSVVKEVEEGILHCYSPRSDTLCLMMDVDQAKDEPGANSSPIKRLRHNVHKHYRQYASMGNLVNFKTGKKTLTYLRSLADTFIAGVASLLKAQMRQREYDVAQQLTEGSEAIQHVRIAHSESDNCKGNDATLEQVKSLLDLSKSDSKIVLLCGKSGTGKTSLAAQIARSAVMWEPRRKVVFRCLGMTLRSSSLFRVLESLTKQLSFVYSLALELPVDLTSQEAVSLFCSTLKSISEKRTLCGDLLLVLDQIDRLPDLEVHFLLCILNSLGEGISLVLTLQSPHELLNVLKSHPSVKNVKLLYMNKVEITECVTSNLHASKRIVTTDQLHQALKTLPRDPIPVYAQLLLHLLKLWPSHSLPEFEKFKNDPQSDCKALLASIEGDLGKAFSRHALSFLATARHGLAAYELLHLLSTDADILNEIKEENGDEMSVVEGFPYQLQLSKLVSRLGKFLVEVKIEGESVYRVMCQPLIDCIKSRYMSERFSQSVHLRLANFFQFIRRGLLLSSRDISEQKHQRLSKYHWRTLRCVPFHLCFISSSTAEVWSALKEKVFFNFAWLVNAVYSGFFNDLLDDITFALDVVSLDPDIQYLRQLLLSVRHTVIHNPTSLAAVFSSQKVDDLHNMKDSVKSVVEEARVWLKQVHLQALVPVSYTSDKTSRLLVKENGIFGVKALTSVGDTGTLLVQRDKSLLRHNVLTCEEMPLATLTDDIISFHICGDENVCVLVRKETSTLQLEVFSLEKGRHLKSISLGDRPLLWLDIRTPNTSFFANDTAIKSLDLNRGVITNIISWQQSFTAACISTSKPERVITVNVDKKTTIDYAPVKNVSAFKELTLRNEIPNKHCCILKSTKDGKYIVHVTERQALVVEASMFKVHETFSLNGLPIVMAEFSRSHEHLFLAYANCAITCHILYSGTEAMNTKLKPKPKPRVYTSHTAARQSRMSPRTGGSARMIAETDTIISMLTSEDDHFLICGTRLGHAYVIHVPTGQQLVDITTGQKSINTLIFLTDRGHFQHLITGDSMGNALHWNLRPLIKQTRLLLQPYILDEDLYKEEEAKLELDAYHRTFEAKRNNRVFLNGPDIAAFYTNPPEDTLHVLMELDPAFAVQQDWEMSGSLENLTEQLVAIASGQELGDMLLTVSADLRLARWSLHDGGLMWSKKLPREGNEVQALVSVYYDQAALVVAKFTGRQTVTLMVIYTGEGQTKTMIRRDVTAYWISRDNTKIIMMCEQPQIEDKRLFLWDLINGQEETWQFSNLQKLGDDASQQCPFFAAFSPSLNQCIRVDVPPPESTTTHSPHPSGFDGRRSQGSVNSNRPVGNEGDSPFAVDGQLNESFDAVENDRFTSEDARSPANNSKQPISVESNVGPAAAADSSRGSRCPSRVSETPQPRPGSGDQNKSVFGDDDGLIEKEIERKTTIHWSKGKMDPKPEQETLMVPRFDKLGRRNSWSITSRAGFGSRSRIPVEYFPRRASLHIDGSGKLVPENIKTNGGDSPDDVTETEPTEANFTLLVTMSTISFVSDEHVLVGTTTGHVLVLKINSFNTFCVLGVNEDPLLLPADKNNITLRRISPPHEAAVTYVASSTDGSSLVSADNSSICLWDVATRMLKMEIRLDPGQQITHLQISKDANLVVVATNDRTLRLWSPVGLREIANYKTNFDILDLQMTSDCRKIAVQGVGQEDRPVLEIFEVKNIDDVLMLVAERKKSHQHEVSENLKDERKRRASRRMSEMRRDSLPPAADLDLET